jgi:hypothetical protein
MDESTKAILAELLALIVDCRSLPPANDAEFYAHAELVREAIFSK